MSISVSFGAFVFLLGAVVGALLTRLQWRAFKQKVLQEMMEQAGADPFFDEANITSALGFARSAPAVKAPVGEHISWTDR